jgi:hypothetical protein
MFTELMAKIDALRGQETIEPHQLLDTLKDALGQCQSFLQQRGPVAIAINDSEYELRGQGGYKLPQHNFTGGDGQGDLSGYGSNYSFMPMFNPAMPASVNGFHHPIYGYPLMFPSGTNFEWNLGDIFAPLMVSNAFSYFQLPDAWQLGIDARQGVVHNALGGFHQGVNVFAPINVNNNPQANNNQVCIIAHGDMVVRNIFMDGDLNVNNNVNIFLDLFVGGDLEVDNLIVNDIDFSNIAGYNASGTLVLTIINGVPTFVATEEC